MLDEVNNLEFLPGHGVTGRAFITGAVEFGVPTVAIVPEQADSLPKNLAYIMSCPMYWKKSCILGVMNIDFSCTEKNSSSEEKKD
jgi:hypothetical protein